MNLRTLRSWAKLSLYGRVVLWQPVALLFVQRETVEISRESRSRSHLPNFLLQDSLNLSICKDFFELEQNICAIFINYLRPLRYCVKAIMCAKYFRYYKTFWISREGGHFHMKYLSRYWNVWIKYLISTNSTIKPQTIQ